MEYTVVLRYPDYYASEWPDETYTTIVTASGYKRAVRKAQRETADACNSGIPTDEHPINAPEDLQAIAVIRGAHTVYIPQ